MPFRLAYVSSSKKEILHRELQCILAVPRTNNAAVGITGLLIYHDGNFIQFLEGTEAAVRDCFTRIGADKRHRNCIVLQRAEVEARSFPDWSMGYLAPEQLGADKLGGLSDLVALRKKAETGVVSGDKQVEIFLRSFFSGFKDI